MRPNNTLIWQKIHTLEADMRDQKFQQHANTNPVQIEISEPVLLKIGKWFINMSKQISFQTRKTQATAPISDSYDCQCKQKVTVAT